MSAKAGLRMLLVNPDENVSRAEGPFVEYIVVYSVQSTITNLVFFVYFALNKKYSSNRMAHRLMWRYVLVFWFCLVKITVFERIKYLDIYSTNGLRKVS